MAQIVVFKTRRGGKVAKVYKSPTSAARAIKGLKKSGLRPAKRMSCKC